MRISTAGMHLQSLQSMLQRQAGLARTSEQMSSGVKFSRAGQDPAGATAAQRLDHALASLGQLGKNAGTLQHRLELQEHAITDAGDRLSRVRDLVIGASNGAMSDHDRAMSAIEIRQIREELVSIGNRQDGSGRALFAGTRDSGAPFTLDGNGVTYSGNEGRNSVEVAPGLALADTDPGSTVFTRVPTADGGERDVFATLAAIADALETPRDQLADPDVLQGLQADLDSAQEHLRSLRAGTGARLATVENAAESRGASELALKTTLSDLRDTDYADAATRFAMQLTALESAQLVASRMQGLSLFNKL